MILTDIIVLVFILAMLVRGWRSGGIVMLGNLAGIFFGAVVTTYGFHWLQAIPFFSTWQAAHPVFTVLAFIVVMGIVAKLLSLLVSLIDGLYRVVSIIPLLGPANNLVGALVGSILGVLIIVLAAYLCDNVLFPAHLIPINAEIAITSSSAFYYAVTLLRHVTFLFPVLTMLSP